MWFVRNGKSYSSTDGVNWTQRSATGAIGGTASRAYASLTSYNNQLWYIAGAPSFLPGGPSTPAVGTAVNDVWRSGDGIAWTQVTANATFPTAPSACCVRSQQPSLGVRRAAINGATAGPPPNGCVVDDGWNHLDTGIARASGSIYWLTGVVQQAIASRWSAASSARIRTRSGRRADGESWTELAPVDYAPHLLTAASLSTDVAHRRRPHGRPRHERHLAQRRRSQLESRDSRGSDLRSADTHRVLVFNNRLWVIAGWDYFTTEGGTQTYNNEVWSSADGVSWTQHPNGGISRRAPGTRLWFNGKMWVIGGTDGNVALQRRLVVDRRRDLGAGAGRTPRSRPGTRIRSPR